jgi:predicted oxidoreductase
MKLGTWGAKMNTKEMEYFIDGCLDLALPLFDHADIYGGHTTEEAFGDVIRRRPDLKSKVQIITKCGIAHPSEKRPDFQIKHYNTSASYIQQSIDRSLKNLGVDHLDSFLIHRPDILMNPNEIAEAMNQAMDSGKVKKFGVSNFNPSQFELLNASISLETNQIQASIVHLDPFIDGTLDQLQKLGKRPTAWSPLGGGGLFTSEDEREVRIRKMGKELAEEHSCTMDQLIMAWLMKHPSGIVPVTGTSKLERLKLALESLKVNLSHEDWYRLWTASTGRDVP